MSKYKPKPKRPQTTDDAAAAMAGAFAATLQPLVAKLVRDALVDVATNFLARSGVQLASDSSEDEHAVVDDDTGLATPAAASPVAKRNAVRSGAAQLDAERSK